MKVLSRPQGDGLLTNVEVHAWLKEKNFEARKRDLKPDQIRPTRSTVNLARDLHQYLETSPAGNETVQSVKSLFTKLEKFKLSSPELLMIANIRPEGYAHLTPLLIDADSRFDEDQLYEMLGLINDTLKKRPNPLDPGADGADGTEGTAAATCRGTAAAKSGVEDTAMKQMAENMAHASIAAESQAVQTEHAVQDTASTITAAEIGSPRVSLAQSTQNMARTDTAPETQDMNVKRVTQASSPTTSIPGSQSVLTQEGKHMASMGAEPRSHIVKAEQMTRDTALANADLTDRSVSMTAATQNTEHPPNTSGIQGVKVKHEAQDITQRPIAAQERDMGGGIAGPHASQHAAETSRDKGLEEGDAAQNVGSEGSTKGVGYVSKIKQERMEDR